MPIVVFLSDGLVGNEAEVIKRIQKYIGNTRIYSFGVGTSVNRYLMDGVAVSGRGYARYIDPTDNASEVAAQLAKDLKTPILTDIEIDWGKLEASQATPNHIADLFEGGSTRVYARYLTGGKYTITVKGKVNGRPVELPMEIDLPNQVSDAPSNALPLIWARRQIAALTLDYNTNMGNKSELQDRIIKLSLDYSLQSKFTSFVAVSKRVYNETPAANANKSVALPKVAGMSQLAYPTALTGSSTPEPETMLGLMLALVLAIGRYWKRIRSRFFMRKGCSDVA